MSAPMLPDFAALSLDDLKKLVVQLLVRVTALEEENARLREENARLKDLPRKPKLAPGGMDQAREADKRTTTKAARRQRRHKSRPKRTPPTHERTLTISVPAGSRRKGYETYTNPGSGALGPGRALPPRTLADPGRPDRGRA